MQEYWKVKLLIEFCRLKRVFFALGNIRFQPNSDVGFLWMGGVTCVGDGKSRKDKWILSSAIAVSPPFHAEQLESRLTLPASPGTLEDRQPPSADGDSTSGGNLYKKKLPSDYD